MRKKFHGEMSITCMKKVVSEEVGDGCRQLSILFHEVGDHSINFAVPILNSSQSLNMFVQMVPVSSLTSFSRERRCTMNGLKLMMESGTIYYHFVWFCHLMKD
jgi:hypothetical protein